MSRADIDRAFNSKQEEFKVPLGVYHAKYDMIDRRPLVAKLDRSDKPLDRITGSTSRLQESPGSPILRAEGPLLKSQEIQKLQKKFTKEAVAALGSNSKLNI